jgi:hypothetical protein
VTESTPAPVNPGESANTAPGVGIIATGWTLSAFFAVIAIITLFVNLTNGNGYLDNAAGDLATTKALTYAVIWAVLSVTAALLALSGHIRAGFAKLAEADK